MSNDPWDNLFAWGDEMVKKYGITREDVDKAVQAVRRDLAEGRKANPMADDITRILSTYDVDKVCRELEEFLKEDDE